MIDVGIVLNTTLAILLSLAVLAVAILTTLGLIAIMIHRDFDAEGELVFHSTPQKTTPESTTSTATNYSPSTAEKQTSKPSSETTNPLPSV